MSAKNSGATADDYAKYDADKAKAGEPQPQVVTMQIWRSEDKLPIIPEGEDFGAQVLIWLPDGSVTTARLFADWPDDGDLIWDFGEDSEEIKGTRWCHIPKLQEVEL